MEEVLLFLNSIRPLSPECKALLLKIVKSRQIRANEILLRMGDINRHLFFIKKGVLCCYYYVEEKTVSDWFFWENHTVVSIGSFYDQAPSEDYIIALEDCELFYITKEEFDHLCETFHEFCLIAKHLLTKYLKEFHGYIRLIRKRDADERYQLVLDKMTDLIHRIPGKWLASWLGMDEATLSRARGRSRGTKR